MTNTPHDLDFFAEELFKSNTGYGIRDTGYGIQDTGYGIRDTGSQKSLFS